MPQVPATHRKEPGETPWVLSAQGLMHCERRAWAAGGRVLLLCCDVWLAQASGLRKMQACTRCRRAQASGLHNGLHKRVHTVGAAAARSIQCPSSILQTQNGNLKIWLATMFRFDAVSSLLQTLVFQVHIRGLHVHCTSPDAYSYLSLCRVMRRTFGLLQTKIMELAWTYSKPQSHLHIQIRTTTVMSNPPCLTVHPTLVWLE